MVKYKPEEITYELFGIDPVSFYENKYALGESHSNYLANPVFHYELGYECFRRMIGDLKALLPLGGKVLDLGCGSGIYGPTVLANVSNIELYGIDMSETCLAQALANGYSQCKLHNLSQPIPYDDEYFEAVFSMDLFGHIEFRHKDFLIEEAYRVTKGRGVGHHGIETGFIDYFNCDPLNENNPIRKYVLLHGHIGTEPAKAVCQRFSKYFDEVKHQVTYLYPYFADKDYFANQFEEEFARLVKQHNHPESRQLFLIIMGRLNRYFIDQYSRVFGKAFQPYDSPPKKLDKKHEKANKKMLKLLEDYNRKFGIDFVPTPRELFRPGGYSSLTVKKF